VRERGLADTGNIFQKQMTSCEKADHRHFYDARLPFDDARDIVLDGPDPVHRCHGEFMGCDD
jgi:hypothetical protein